MENSTTPIFLATLPVFRLRNSKFEECTSRLMQNHQSSATMMQNQSLFRRSPGLTEDSPAATTSTTSTVSYRYLYKAKLKQKKNIQAKHTIKQSNPQLRLWLYTILLVLTVSIYSSTGACSFFCQKRTFLLVWEPPADANRRAAANSVRRAINTTATTTTRTDHDPSLHIPQRTPTHHACDNYNGILHIASGDLGGAFSAVYFQYIASQLLYAERHRLLPFVHLNNVSAYIYDPIVHGQGGGGDGVAFVALVGKKPSILPTCPLYRKASQLGPPMLDDTTMETQKTLHLRGTGAFEHYFEPVSDFVPGDRSCETKPYITLEEAPISRQLHVNSKWAVLTWRYERLQDYIAQPHIPYNEWSEYQRQKGSLVVTKYLKVRPYIREWAERVNPSCTHDQACLGMHIRHTDKASNRRVLEVGEFLPFAQSFVDNGGAHIYIATDSRKVMETIQTEWPERVRSKVRTMGDDIVRSSSETAVFHIANHHRTNQEILVEILALANCQFLINGHSAVTEATFWLNFDLHFRSVNLEDPDHLSPHSFGELVTMVLKGKPQDDWPQPVRTNRWWERQPSELTNVDPSNDHACDTFDGVLLISSVRRDAGFASAFFKSVLVQLIYADRHNLKPVIHLTEEAQFVHDKQIHGTGTQTSFVMMGGAKLGLGRRSPMLDDEALSSIGLQKQRFILVGTGVWKSYFEPVSDFVLSDSSCREKPLIDLDTSQLEKLELEKTSFAFEIVNKYYKVQPHIERMANEVNHGQQPCLAVHIAGTPNNYREPSVLLEYIKYIEAFERAGGVRIFFASDNAPIMNFILDAIPSDLADRVASQGRLVARTTDHEWPIHFYDDNHRLNSETLVDVLALSKCQMMVHGSSMVPKAAIYFNPELEGKSVNLDVDTHWTPRRFEELVVRETSGVVLGRRRRKETPISNSLKKHLPKPKSIFKRVSDIIQFLKYDPSGHTPCIGYGEMWKLLSKNCT